MSDFQGDLNTTSLEEGKQWLRARVKKGAECPLCKRYAKAYKRKLNAGMVWSLIKLYQLEKTLQAPNRWVHFTEEMRKAKRHAVDREYSKLRFWDLIETAPNNDPTVRGSGYWRTTQQGRDFITGKATVPRFVWVYDNSCFAVSKEMTTVREALTDKFDYDELMRGV